MKIHIIKILANIPSPLVLAVLLTCPSLGICGDAGTSMSQPHKGKVDSVDSLTEGLRQRLAKNPSDIKGWVLLAKSYQYLDRLEDAGAAYEKAKSLGYDGPVIPAVNTEVVKPKNHYGRYSPHAKISNAMAQGIAEAVNKTPVSGAKPGVKVSVSLSPELVKTVPEQSSVFIFARAAGQAGPPLAAARKKVSDLPLTLQLDDSMAMMPGRNISSAEKIIVGARISTSGYATKSEGDIEVLSRVVSSASPDAVELVLLKN